MTSSLSYHDKFAWGLRVKPSFDDLAGTVKKPLRIPIPDRSAKWFALSNYRSFMVDQAKAYGDYEHLRIDYNQSGARLPASAAMTRPSINGDDVAWLKNAEFNQRVQQEEQHNLAVAALEAQRKQMADEIRVQQLSAFAPTLSGWHIEANHEDLEAAGVDHDAPVKAPKLKPVRLPAPVTHPVAAGQIGLLRPFPTFEQLNMGQKKTYASMGALPKTDSTYDQLRKNALGR
jgi:hypothetical protein